MKLKYIRPWAEDVILSLQKLGGQGTALEIAEVVKQLTKHKRKTNNWKSSVLNVLNDYCSTKINYINIKHRTPNHPSLFVDVGRKGRETIWGLDTNAELYSKLHIKTTDKLKSKSDAKNIDHTKWAKLALKALVNHIKNFKGGKKYLTYGELAKQINYPLPHSGNLFGSNIGKTLGTMGHLFGDMIIDGEQVPLIQVLVVSSSSKLPSDGLKEFNNTYPTLSKKKKRDFALLEYHRAFEFGNRWEKVLQELGIDEDDRSPEQKRSKRYNPYGSEGSPEHIRLRDYIADHPNVIGLDKILKGKVEYPLKSGDSIDVAFELNEQIVGVEVKSLRSGTDDLERGIFQCIKYKAVLEAENNIEGTNKTSNCILVLEGSLTKSLKRVSRKLGVKVFENISPSA